MSSAERQKGEATKLMDKITLQPVEQKGRFSLKNLLPSSRTFMMLLLVTAEIAKAGSLEHTKKGSFDLVKQNLNLNYSSTNYDLATPTENSACTPTLDGYLKQVSDNLATSVEASENAHLLVRKSMKCFNRLFRDDGAMRKNVQSLLENPNVQENGQRILDSPKLMKCLKPLVMDKQVMKEAEHYLQQLAENPQAMANFTEIAQSEKFLKLIKRGIKEYHQRNAEAHQLVKRSSANETCCDDRPSFFVIETTCYNVTMNCTDINRIPPKERPVLSQSDRKDTGRIVGVAVGVPVALVLYCALFAINPNLACACCACALESVAC